MRRGCSVPWAKAVTISILAYVQNATLSLVMVNKTRDNFNSRICAECDACPT